jgi:hypothetical protein
MLESQADPIKISNSTLLVVEGKDEEFFFAALLRQMGLSGIQVLPIGGKDRLKMNLSLLRVSPDFSMVKSLVIIRDADDDSDSSFQSVCYCLGREGLSVPKKPGEFTGSHPRVCVIVMPGGGTPGMLEDLCLKSVSSYSEMKCVDDFFQCLKIKGASFPKKESKARVQVFLASREETMRHLGLAAEKGYWPWDSPVFSELKSLLLNCAPD